MRWPFKRKSSGDQWVVSWSGQVLCYVAARVTATGKWDMVKMGVEVQGEDSMELFVQRLQTLGLKGANAVVMLRPEQYQLLQIDTPPVAPEELKSAARYQIRDLLDVHIDDVTLDIMKVGDGQQKGAEHLFVVAATNAVIRQPMELATAMDWDVSVIDIQENAQRNLQTAVARAAGSAARAQALLVISDERQAVLTISANEELFYTRRLDLPKGFMDMAWEQADAPALDDGFTPVQEYVPDYNGGGASYGTDYSAAAPAGGGNEQAQRVLVEVQRSLDLWDRTWSALPLAGLQVMAGDRSAELATWLGREMGQTVGILELSGLFGGLDVTAANQRAVCAPLLGVLLRTEARKL